MRKDARICIIGAGPAGLSAAFYLQMKGYENFTVLEKEDRVGGKCFSPSYADQHYEMGAIWGDPSYHTIRELEKYAGISHSVQKLKKNYKDLTGKVIDPFSFRGNPLHPLHLLKLKKQMKKFTGLLESKYQGYELNGHRRIAEGRYEGFRADEKKKKISGVNGNLKDLSLFFRDFCRINGVELVQEFLSASFTGLARGYLDEIPAAYVLKSLNLENCLNPRGAELWAWKNGTQSIWEALNEKLLHPARLGSYISHVGRQNGKVYVTVNNQTEEYDAIILTTPFSVPGESREDALPGMTDYFDAREDEKFLFSKIDYTRCDLLSFTTESRNYPGFSYFIWENLKPERLGHMTFCYRRFKGVPEQVLTAYSIRKHKNSSEISHEEAKETLLADLKAQGNPVSEIVGELSPYCFPHILSKDYACGWYDKVESLQGKYSTYYAGEIMSCGNMNAVAEYSRQLIERFF